MKLTTALFAFAAGALAASPALAASDVFIKFDGVDGEAAVAGWSFGACNAGQCTKVVSPRDTASGQASGKAGKPGKPSTTTWDIKKSEGARTAGGVRVAVGDVDGDGLADLAYAGTQAEVSKFSITFDKASPVLAKVCAGKHFPKATLTARGETYEITDATVTCSSSAADALTDGLLILRISSGQMKHTKSGHVTLLK
jgi:type VI protein secretion system component Hcp